MSYSNQKAKYGGLPSSSGATPVDIRFVQRASDDRSMAGDFAVETWIGMLRGEPCLFRFKVPLGAAFEVARDSAANCLEFGDPPAPRKIRHWISDGLKCTDVILLVYLQGVEGREIPCPGPWLKERDLYDAFEGLAQEGLQRVGAIHHAIYQVRSSEFEHCLRKGGSGRVEIRRLSRQAVLEKYAFVRGYFAESMGIMVSVYRARFPAHCPKSD